MSISLASLHQHIPRLLSPVHPLFPYGLIDIIGAMRLSSVVNWMASGAFDQPDPATPRGKGKKAGYVGRIRASIFQELAGILIVVFGGETFLSLCTGATPSWLISSKLALLFCGIHTLQTRTFLIKYLPKAPSLPLELALAIPDAIGRTLLLTRFSILSILRAPPSTSSTTPTLPPTTSTLLLTPFILAVPFASIVFSGLNLFSNSPKLTIPAELKPGGWMFVDAWIPVVVPILFLSLIGPVKGWEGGLGWNDEEAIVACMGFVGACFLGRAVYNFGYKREQWLAMVGLEAGGGKIKTA